MTQYKTNLCKIFPVNGRGVTGLKSVTCWGLGTLGIGWVMVPIFQASGNIPFEMDNILYDNSGAMVQVSLSLLDM